MKAAHERIEVKNEGRGSRHETRSSTGPVIAPPSYGVEFVDRNGGDVHRMASGGAAAKGTIQPVQLKRAGDASADAIHRAAREGIRTHSTALPYAKDIQESFGRHDISGIRFHDGAEAARSARAMRAQAYCTDGHVVSAGPLSKHTAAHEAAHHIQQQGGVRLDDHVGTVGDRYERHADDVASAVVQGRSAEALLDRVASTSADAGSTSATTDVQMARPEPDDKHDDLTTIAQTVGGPDGAAYAGQVYVRKSISPSPAMVVRGKWAERLATQNNVNEGDIMVKDSSLATVTSTPACSRGLLAHEVAHWTLDVTNHPLALYQHEVAAARAGDDATLRDYLNAQLGTTSNYAIMAAQVTKSDAATEFLSQMKLIADG